MLSSELIVSKSPVNLPWIQLHPLSWWLEISTAHPDCIYWFGPFANPLNARKCQPGYVKDLAEEQADNISVILKYCQPKLLTFCLVPEFD